MNKTKMSQKQRELENNKLSELKYQILADMERIKNRRDLNKKETDLWWTLNGQYDILGDIIHHIKHLENRGY